MSFPFGNKNSSGRKTAKGSPSSKAVKAEYIACPKPFGLSCLIDKKLIFLRRYLGNFLSVLCLFVFFNKVSNSKLA